MIVHILMLLLEEFENLMAALDNQPKAILHLHFVTQKLLDNQTYLLD